MSATHRKEIMKSCWKMLSCIGKTDLGKISSLGV